MFIELHILQNFAPANLNRDDTGSPKDCEFGGFRRARVSSQCFKRAIRTCFQGQKLLPEAALAVRSKRFVGELTRQLAARGKPESDARAVAIAALTGAGLKVVKDNVTEYLLFLGQREIDAIAGICLDYWDDLVNIAADETASGEENGRAARTARQKKQAARATVPKPIQDALSRVLDGGRAADLALFGRMIADLPEKNVDAACQVAHAISTNKVSIEFDFYTAVDDLKPGDTAGADMLGTVEFNSACFYRYANVDLDQLARNLDGDQGLALQTVDAFIEASILAVPTGKQSSMAAQNPPSFVLAVARETGLWSLANAFCRPIRPENGDLVQNSVRALDGYWGRLTRMYGEKSVVGKWVCSLEDDGLAALADARVESVGHLIEQVRAAARFTPREEGRP